MRYEICVCIQTGDIVRVAGPYKAGRYADLSIFRLGGLKQLLLDAGEMAEADNGYKGEPFAISLPDDGPAWMSTRKKDARSRHETVNKRFKDWGCMSGVFAYDIKLHTYFFRAVAALTQLQFNYGYNSFEIRY